MSRSRSPIHLCSAIVLVVSAAASLAQSPGLPDRASARIDELHDRLIEIRRDFHRHPEVSGSEQRTSSVIAAHLEKLGLSVRTGVGGYGVVGRLDGAQPGPVVAYRADMDAVPSDAPDPVDFASETPGVRHICGHDLHTAIGLALAEGFAAIRDDLAGSVVFVFQPAEERATGARAMIADGALDDHDPVAIFALHTAPMNVGQLATRAGTMMAWRDRVVLEVTGDEAEDVAGTLRRSVLSIATLEPAQAVGPAPDNEFLYPQLAAVAGSGDTWTFGGTVTVASDSGTERAQRLIDREIDEHRFGGIQIGLDYEPRWIAGVDNDPDLTARASATVRSVLGPDSVLDTGGVVPAFSEDFGSFQQTTPGVMFFLGVSNPEKGWVGMPHSPGYVADEEAIGVGAKVMAAVILDVLADPPG